MLIRRRFPLWVLAAVVLGTAAGAKLARRAVAPGVPRPGTVHELRQLLLDCDPPLHVVEMSDVGEEAGVYFCVKPQTREQLCRLHRDPAYAELWKGVVFCAQDPRRDGIPPDELNSWGEYGLRVGDLLLFGDPALLDCIRKATGQDRARRGFADAGFSVREN